MSPGCGCCAPPWCGYANPVTKGCFGDELPGATVTLSQTGVTSLVLDSGGSGYTNGSYTNGAFTNQGSGTGAKFSYVVSGGAVQSVTLTGYGDGYSLPPTSPPTPTVSAGAGSGFSATATVSSLTVDSATSTGHVVNLTSSAGGSGYTPGSYTNGTFSGGGGTGGSFSYVIQSNGSLNIGSLVVTDGGQGYTSAPTALISAGSGSGAVINVFRATTARIGIPRADYYTYTQSFSNYANQVLAKQSITCSSAWNANQPTITGSPATGYSCASACLNFVPIKSTLSVTDPVIGTFTAPFDPTGATYTEKTVSVTGAALTPSCPASTSTISAKLRFWFTSSSTNIVMNIEYGTTCVIGGTNYLSDGTPSAAHIATVSNASAHPSCTHFSDTFARNFLSTDTALQTAYGTGTVTWTVSEAP